MTRIHPKKKLQAKLTKDFQIYCQKFQEVSKLSAQKERDTPLNFRNQPSRGMNFQSPSGTYVEDPLEEERKSLLSASNKQQFMLVENDREFMEAQMEEREKGIKEIETTIIEINEITRDLSTLVHEQGILIDNIETHIDVAVQHSTQGVEELRKASDYQKSGKSYMCWIVLILTVAVVIILASIIIPILVKS